jgi:hypothetical protein
VTDLDRDGTAETPADFLERSIRMIAVAIAMAGALIALAIYWRPGPARYQAVTVGDQVVRLNTRSGSMVACNVQKCGFVIHESRGIDENRGYALLPPMAAPVTQSTPQKSAIPAPSAAPAAPAPPAAPKGR